MNITLGFDVIGTEIVDIEVDDDKIAGMDDDEIIDYVQDKYYGDAEDEARKNCDYGIGQLESITFNGEEHWVGV